MLQPLIISAPFGNYIQPQGATPTLGTFTLMDRPGRVPQILKTVRYYPRLKAWVNKIGLRNPGLPWLAKQVEAGKKKVDDQLVSIHGFNDDEWYQLLDMIASVKPMGVELNMSCPNVGHIGWPEDLFERAVATGLPIVAKLPPVRYEMMAQQAVAAGVRWFHCCNTLPVDAGGLSGRPLKPVALQCIYDLKEQSWFADADCKIIAGGGIYATSDIDDYLAAGVQHVALGTKVMNKPWCLLTDAPLRPLIEYASTKLVPSQM